MEGESSKTYVFGNEGATVPAWAALMNGNNGLFGNGGGWGGGILGFFLGLLFGNGWGGFGGFGGGSGSAGTGFLSNQLTNESTKEILLNAINGTDADVRTLASTVNADVNEVRSAVSALQNGITSLAGQTGLGFQQIINSIQSGNSSLMSKLCDCCCENRLLTTQQGYESRIATIEQTNQLGSQADRNTRTLADAIAAQTVAMNDGFCAIKERELQGKIDSLLADNAVLRSTISENRQTERFLGAFNTLDSKITELAAKQPQTVPVVWPNLTAVNTTPFGGYYGYGYQGNIWG